MRASTNKIFPRSIGSESRSRYPVIVGFIERAIASGNLQTGERLPTQRVLAKHLGTAVGTITRAYSEAERLGLIIGEVGRGTYVSKVEDPDVSAKPTGLYDASIDMTVSRPPNAGAARYFANALRLLSKRRDLSDLLGIEPTQGWLRHRFAAAKWISGRGVSIDASQVVACNGVQHALSVIFAAFSSPGDVVATEELNYPGIKLLADTFHLRLLGLPMDDEGLRADALEKACRRHVVKFVLCSPTAHNPTAVTMSMDRRNRLAQAAVKHDLIIVENDISGMMSLEPLPALASLVPGRTCYVTGLTKVVAAGFRLGFVAASTPLLDRLTTAVHTTTWMPPPLMLEILTLWVEDGSIDKIVDWHRREVSARVELARRVLGDAGYRYDHATYHLWLQLPKLWEEHQFVDHAQDRGVSVLPGKMFAVNRHTPVHRAVRISLGALNNRERVEKGLRVLAALLTEKR